MRQLVGQKREQDEESAKGASPHAEPDCGQSRQDRKEQKSAITSLHFEFANPGNEHGAAPNALQMRRSGASGGWYRTVCKLLKLRSNPDLLQVSTSAGHKPNRDDGNEGATEKIHKIVPLEDHDRKCEDAVNKNK